ncbi:hypothetical protein AB0O07_35840 [Streptomyces sp. NPDC093085]|uniref:hypothetical protein n=1 Tax=Streptomyces sp. NPDC093085 TaxID=3155068 RepID=UPI00343B05AD
MAATEESVDDDALYVLTAALLTPARFPAVLGDDYPEACGALGLVPYPGGYGLVLGQDGTGARWTVVVDDVSLVAVAIASWDCGMEYDLSPGERTVVCALPGWPMALAVAAPGVPAPHDPVPEPAPEPGQGTGSGPEPDGGAAGPGSGAGPEGVVRLPLTPPDTSAWGPAQRRLGADEVAAQWASWRERFDEAEDAEDAGDVGDVGDAPDAVASAQAGAAMDAVRAETPDASGGRPAAGGTGHPPAPSHPGVVRVLAELRAYVDATATAPPLGRVRSGFAPGEARSLRADGPGWSFVARTDDMAFVLLDGEPGEVLPVGRGPELPGLLTALDEIAVRPT